MNRSLVIFAFAGCLASSLSAQALYAPKGKPAVYTAPHKPHTKVADVKAKNASKKEWRELVVDDQHLRSEYFFAQPGFKHPKALHPDTRAWWVVLEGEVDFDIETVGVVHAKKGSMVQVPFQTFFSYEVVGSAPALMFETNVAGAKTLFANQADAPKMPGFDFIPVKFPGREIARFMFGNKPHVTFDQVAAQLDKGEIKGTIRIVEDDRGTANFIYGYNKSPVAGSVLKPLPPLDEKNRGHYHVEGSEYWLIMKGQVRYPIEKVGVVVASEGDVVYVPPSTFHAPRWWGEGQSCRLAMNGFPRISHLFE